MRRWLIVLLLASCRDKAAPPAPAPAAPPAAPQVAKPIASPPSAPTPMPALPPVDGPDPRGMPPAEQFAAEHEDRVWKGATEQQLRERLAKLPGAQIECKQTICLVTLGSDAGGALDQLQQLQDVAHHVTLTRDDKTIRAYVSFDRPAD